MLKMSRWVEEQHVSVEVTEDRGVQVGVGGRRHHFLVRLSRPVDETGELAVIDNVPWRQDPDRAEAEADAAAVMDMLVGNAECYVVADDYEDFCLQFAYNPDDPSTRALWHECRRSFHELCRFAGSTGDAYSLIQMHA